MNYMKTEAGQQAFKERSSLFSARQRTAFIMFDGVKSVEQVLAATTGLGLTQEDIASMVTYGFLTPAPGQVAIVEAAAAQTAAQRAAEEFYGARTPQERYADAKPLAIKLSASLGLRGFMINLSVEAAAGYDDLLALLPKLQDALGHQACRELERALKG